MASSSDTLRARHRSRLIPTSFKTVAELRAAAAALALVGGLAAVLAGGILTWIGYGGLALVALFIVAAVTVLSPYARR